MATNTANKNGASAAASEAHLHATGTAAPALSVREKPILMSGEMVRAILDGRKTMTRRVIKPQPMRDIWGKPKVDFGDCPYGMPGDRLWVRETYRTLYDPATCLEGARDIDYRADGVERIMDRIRQLHPATREGKWKPAIFMPRWASRITLEILSVRVERLQEITEDDAKAEGAPWLLVPLAEEGPTPATIKGHGHRMGFVKLWDSLNAKRGFGWETNPWVWKIEFRRAQ